MLSNYPPGVTGNEPEIAGYPESSETMWCHVCQSNMTVDVIWPNPFEYEGQCPSCETDLSGNVMPDPDHHRDLHMDDDAREREGY